MVHKDMPTGTNASLMGTLTNEGGTKMQTEAGATVSKADRGAQAKAGTINGAKQEVRP